MLLGVHNKKDPEGSLWVQMWVLDVVHIVGRHRPVDADPFPVCDGTVCGFPTLHAAAEDWVLRMYPPRPGPAVQYVIHQVEKILVSLILSSGANIRLGPLPLLPVNLQQLPEVG